MEEIPTRPKTDGWDAVRPAISTTVKCVKEVAFSSGSAAELTAFDSGWVMRAFIEDRLKDNLETALDFLLPS